MFDLARASDREPLGEITLGERRYEVPPLSFARFMDLLALPAVSLLALCGPENADKCLCGMALVAPWIFAPAVPREEWEGEESHKPKMEMALLVLGRHQWGAVLDFIRFGLPPEPGEVSTTRLSLNAALLAFTQRNSAYTVHELYASPFDYTYGLLAAQRELNDRDQEGEEGYVDQAGPMPSGMGEASDEEKSSLLEALERAN